MTYSSAYKCETDLAQENVYFEVSGGAIKQMGRDCYYLVEELCCDSKMCSSKLCDSKLCASKLGVSKLCESKLLQTMSKYRAIHLTSPQKGLDYLLACYLKYN